MMICVCDQVREGVTRLGYFLLFGHFKENDKENIWKLLLRSKDDDLGV